MDEGARGGDSNEADDAIANDMFLNGLVSDTTAGSASVSWSFVPADTGSGFSNSWDPFSTDLPRMRELPAPATISRIWCLQTRCSFYRRAHKTDRHEPN